MALKIDRGLFTANFVDHHAVLGVSIDADPKAIRKRYLKIARQLHPDSAAAKNEGEKQLAQELLSKFVNPAYEKLSQSKEQKEYALLLALKGKSLNQQQDTVVIISKPAQKIAGAGNIAQAYHQVLEELASTQYESLSESVEVIGQISELNMVYLMRQGKQSPAQNFQPTPAPVTEQGEKAKNKIEPSSKPKQLDLVDRAINRAVQFESNGDLTKAIQELRDVIKMYPKHAKVVDCHSRLGNIYLKSKQPTMAKIHFRKALELDASDEIAKAGMRRLDPKATSNSASKTISGKGKNDSSSGILGRLFGKKK